MIFIDSNVIIAYKNADDINHDRSARIFQQFSDGRYGKMIISEFIFIEVTTVLALKRNLQLAKEVGLILLDAADIEIIKASDVFEKAWNIFINQRNTNFNFVDASNLACMELKELKNIATFDEDFLKIKSVNVIRE